MGREEPGGAGDFKRRGTDGDPADLLAGTGGAQGVPRCGVQDGRFAGLIGCHLGMLSARL
jgi:hypothetical protein